MFKGVIPTNLTLEKKNKKKIDFCIFIYFISPNN